MRRAVGVGHVARQPIHTDGEFVKAQHVHDADVAEDAGKQVGALVGTGSHEQAAVGAALCVERDVWG